MDDFEKLKEELLSDPEVRKEYDALEPEFHKVRKEIEAQMKQEELLDTYTEERECDYKGRHYRVRDNGSVLRLPTDPEKPRKGDNEWTFGTFNKRNGYLFIGTHQVHRIIATAFHGNPESGTDIVDHIDTDRQNNRPENLRWTTKLQNALNPATKKKLELMTGMPIEEILKDMSILKEYNLPREYQWLGAVSKEESQRTLQNMKAWTAKPYKRPETPYKPNTEILRPVSPRNISPLRPTPYEMNHVLGAHESEDDGLPAGCIRSLTPNALERGWRAPYKFPFCPQQGGDLKSYFEAIEIGEEVAIGKGYSFFATEKAMNKEETAICLKTLSASGVKPYGVMTITKEDGWFIHEGQGYFKKDGQEKYFAIAMGEEWTGGDVFDDFC